MLLLVREGGLGTQRDRVFLFGCLDPLKSKKAVPELVFSLSPRKAEQEGEGRQAVCILPSSQQVYLWSLSFFSCESGDDHYLTG